jgi:hypothetical protein
VEDCCCVVVENDNSEPPEKDEVCRRLERVQSMPKESSAGFDHDYDLDLPKESQTIGGQPAPRDIEVASTEAASIRRMDMCNHLAGFFPGVEDV